MSWIDYENGRQQGRLEGRPISSPELARVTWILCVLVGFLGLVGWIGHGLKEFFHIDLFGMVFEAKQPHPISARLASGATAPVKPNTKSKSAVIPAQPSNGDTNADAIVTKGMTVRGHIALPSGAELYRVTELKSPFDRMVFDKPTTWFALSPKTCSQYPATDCSQPVAIPDQFWKATPDGKPSMATRLASAAH